MLHIFVYVVRSTQDHFSGIKQALNADGQERIINLCFNDADFDLIDRVEYTERRFIRAFYYPAIFRRLCHNLEQAILQAGDDPVNVYFSDEGVWALVWADFRRRFRTVQIKGINVQHGFAEIRPIHSLLVRRSINLISRFLTGFPCLGYGSLGGAGPNAFDLYLTYDDRAANYIQRRSGCTALVAPRLIKHDLIESFSVLKHTPMTPEARVLFAMNIKMRGSAIKCNVDETFDQLLELATVLHELGACLVLRLHPAMDREVERRKFTAHPISKIAELDSYTSLQQSMANAVMVMSFLSSVLWEASLLGLISVQVICACCNTAKLHFEREELTLDVNLRSRLSALLFRARPPQLQNWRDFESLEWDKVRLALAF